MAAYLIGQIIIHDMEKFMPHVANTSAAIARYGGDRSPTHMYRTAPLAGLWSHRKGGFYHDGRFATLRWSITAAPS